MQYKSLARAISVLLFIIAGFMFLCLLAGFAIGEGTVALRAFAIPISLGIVFFIVMSLAGIQKVELSPRAGYLFVVLAWVSATGLGALPFVLSGSIKTFVDAFFETMSGFTTTGASILTDVEVLPRSVMLWRCTTHWLGGMGIVVLTVAIFPLIGLSGRSLMEAEAPGPRVDKFTPRLSQTALYLWLIYLGMTVILVILLLFGGMDILDSIDHAFGAMATGGFGTKNASVGAFKSAYIDVVLTVFMVLAGANFSIHWKLLHGEFKSAFRDGEWVVYLAIFGVSSCLIAFNLFRSDTFATIGDSLRFGAFQAASILTTTGFATADYLGWPAFAQAILFVLMFIGGCSGSTGGGIKVGRFLTLFKMGLSEMRYLLNPRGIYGVFVNRQYLKKNIVYDIAAMVYLYLGSALVSTLVVASGGFDILTSLTATLASLGNIGPGFGLVGPASNYAFFPDWITAWLSFMMLLGRLEVYTVLIIFTRSFWKR